eukprot:TRINITY_DN54845_c0_g1_i1.p1 TRINITY_DN54845_c0_g1~~TRINITY_DN54845_c0_g1_i1.p1  ORF type:complete len:322 (+),score=29.53 TRINITY_DN54845_c0_g1_i1:40-966(+)
MPRTSPRLIFLSDSLTLCLVLVVCTTGTSAVCRCVPGQFGDESCRTETDEVSCVNAYYCVWNCSSLPTFTLTPTLSATNTPLPPNIGKDPICRNIAPPKRRIVGIACISIGAIVAFIGAWQRPACTALFLGTVAGVGLWGYGEQMHTWPPLQLYGCACAAGAGAAGLGLGLGKLACRGYTYLFCLPCILYCCATRKELPKDIREILVAVTAFYVAALSGSGLCAAAVWFWICDGGLTIISFVATPGFFVAFFVQMWGPWRHCLCLCRKREGNDTEDLQFTMYADGFIREGEKGNPSCCHTLALATQLR